MSPHQASCTLMTNVFNLCVVSRIFTLHQLKSNNTTTQILHAFMVFNEKMTKSSEYGEEFNEQQKVIEQEEKLIEQYEKEFNEKLIKHDINNVDNIQNNMFNHSS